MSTSEAIPLSDLQELIFMSRRDSSSPLLTFKLSLAVAGQDRVISLPLYVLSRIDEMVLDLVAPLEKRERSRPLAVRNGAWRYSRDPDWFARQKRGSEAA